MRGIGIDIVAIKRFQAKKYTRTSTVLKKMFSAHELAYCFSKRNPAAHLATHFAAKEALWKALATSKTFTTPLYSFLLEIEVVHDARGKPDIVFLSSRLKKHHALLSIADSESHAIAVVSIEK